MRLYVKSTTSPGLRESGVGISCPSQTLARTRRVSKHSREITSDKHLLAEGASPRIVSVVRVSLEGLCWQVAPLEWPAALSATRDSLGPASLEMFVERAPKPRT